MNNSRRGGTRAVYRHTGRRPAGSPLLSALFFPAALLYHELLLWVFDRSTSFFDMALLRILLFSLAAGLLVFVVLDLLPWRRAARIAGGVLIGLMTVLFCVERGCRTTFNLYYGFAFMGQMAGNVAGDFGSTVVQVVLGLIPFILLAFVPLAAYIFLAQTVIREDGQETLSRILLAAAMVVFQLGGWALSAFGGAANYYTYEYTANTSIPYFGLATTLRLEVEYAVMGIPNPPRGAFLDDPLDTPAPATGEPSADPSAEPSADVSQPPKEYGFNQLALDFEGMAASESNATIQDIHQYMASLTTSQQNEYTGMFAGKNLILITAEAFSTYAIDKDLTPTLYRMTQEEGFVFHNFYQPDWTLSTIGGEFSVTTGVIPNWMSGGSSPTVSASRAMPITLPHLFPDSYSFPAWHNNTYNYYPRDKYLPNFGYDYKGIGNGLELPADTTAWPESDLEMIEATADSYINAYVEDGTPFHAYYMTVSGHGLYNWGGNAMCRKHQAEVQAKYPDMDETAQAYLACHMELDLALKCLVDKLEAAGIADDTLIVMAADHYPYLINKDNPNLYNEMRGFSDEDGDTSRYKSTLLMWSGSLKEPIEVDTPCCSVDIVPTICNLFGLPYDSRLYSGRDIFATNYQPGQYSNCMPLVVFANNVGKGNSWITAAGTYEANTKTFTPNEGVEVDEDYVKRVHRLVAAKVNYSKLIIQEDYYAHVQFPEGGG